MTDTNELTGRELAVACARAMGWNRNEYGGWYRPDGAWRFHDAEGFPMVSVDDLLAWLQSKAGPGAFLRLESSMVDCPEPWSAERSGDCYVPITHGATLTEALQRLVVAVAQRGSGGRA